METTCHPTLQFSTCVGLERIGRKLNDLLPYPHQRCNKTYSFRVSNLSDSQRRSCSALHGQSSVGLLRSCKASRVAGTTLEPGHCHASCDGNWLLKHKAQEVASFLDGRCIFLVGMMGSGKTTVGKVLSDALGYSFVDSDRIVEQSLGGTSVRQIFKQCGETFFRDIESEALRKLSLMPKQVVATGGGSVVRPINWKYMRQGITVWLDVPLDALARRIAAVGTDSRPLIQFESGDPYTKAFMGLFTLSRKRTEAYSHADARVSLQRIAATLNLDDIADITPTAIAIEVLVQIENFLECQGDLSMRMFP